MTSCREVCRGMPDIPRNDVAENAMPQDPDTPPERRRVPTSTQSVSIGQIDGSLGLSGWMAKVGNLTAMAIIAGSFLWLMNTLITQNRADRIEDRQMFRDALQDLHMQDNRRAGEIK